MQLPVWGGKTLDSSVILVIGAIHGFSLEATIVKRKGICLRFFEEDKETETGCWYHWLWESCNENHIPLLSRAIVSQEEITMFPSWEYVIG